MVVLNDRIGAARFVTKTNATSLDTFQAPEEGYLGVVVGGKPQFETRVDKIHTLRSVFRCASAEGSAEGGDYLWLPGRSGVYVRCGDRPSCRGVLSHAGTGAGSVSVRSAAGIKKAQQAGIVVVRASRTGSGVVPPDDSQPGLVADSSTRQKRVYC